MNGEAFREALGGTKATELDRLGSEKLLIAITGADLGEERVLAAAAASEYAAAETFRRWADDERDARAREAFADVAAQEEEHYGRILVHLGDFDPPEAPGPMHAYLRAREDAVERVATGLVARPLVSLGSHTQVISFFINQADGEMADLFRDLKAETGALIEDGTALLDGLCEDEGDWERARTTAEYLIDVAYDDYVDSLSGLGMDPKPLC